jgi:hypothetical protein
MMKTGVKLTGLAACAVLSAFAAPASAQDGTTQPAGNAPAGTGAAPSAQDQTPPATDQPTSDKSKSDKSDKAAAVQTMETWESYGGGSTESVEETFFRLSRDFVTVAEDGFKPLGSVPIWPRGDLKFIGIRIAPWIREAVQYDNNYYDHTETGPTAGDHGRHGQVTHINEVGALADTNLAGGRLRLNAMADSLWYVNYNNVADEWDFNSAFGATYRWDTGVWVSAGVSYERRHDPADLPNLSNDYARSSTSTFFNLGMDRDIFFGTKIKWEFGVQTYTEKAQDQAFENGDRTEWTAFVKASYPFLRDTTRIFVRLSETWYNNNSSELNDGKSFGMNVGLEGSIPLRQGEYRGLRGQVSVGFESALYDAGTYQRGSATVQSDQNRDATNLNVQVALQYIMSPKSTVDLRYLHGTEFSFYGNYQVVDRVDLTFSHNFTRQLTGRVATFFEHTDPSGNNPQNTVPSNNYYHEAHNVTRWGVGAGVRYAINDWLDVDASTDVDNRNDHADKTYLSWRAILGLTFYLNALTPKVRTAITR